MVTPAAAKRANHEERREREAERSQHLHVDVSDGRKEGEVEREDVGGDQGCALTEVESHQPVEHRHGCEQEHRTDEYARHG
jgi:hypothetical protein